MLKKEGKQAAVINFIFCSDEYLLEINRAYLSHDYYTDIITFSLAPKNQPLVSDIYISIDRVRDNVQRFHTSFTKELHRVIFHGILHLCGYKDATAKQSVEIRKRENYYLAKYVVSRESRHFQD